MPELPYRDPRQQQSVGSIAATVGDGNSDRWREAWWGTAAVTHAVIPSTLDVTLSYTYVTSNNSRPLIFANGTGPSASSGGQYPDVRGSFQRLEAMAKYTFDEGLVRRLGWNGKVFARVRYVWERNSVENWQNDLMQTYMYSAVPFTSYMTWLAWDNPNYNVHMLGGSLGFAW
ncbi:MAG TPA: MtrB/PioB family outer membrane beta-barrel protein [Burkholderiales bacterium]|nr:MtrB/PioB family outer membrane beta-barrel protein [Burkholderiales bacterium]